MIVAGFILVYRKQWQKVWIVSFAVTAGIILLPALYLLLPPRVSVAIEAALDRVAERISPSAAIKRHRSRRWLKSSSGVSGNGSGSDDERTKSSMSAGDIELRP